MLLREYAIKRLFDLTSTNVSVLPGESGNCVFSLKRWLLLRQKHIQITLW